MNEEQYIKIIKSQAEVISNQSGLINDLSKLAHDLTDKVAADVVVSGFSKTEG
ncbi:hypothetical protein [Fructobacillus tropaeoli]|uniref:Uncharacterized protein n=1 Tax=Fructobacillus tropaeoli TaxID=709323 RepID=A0A3F3H441_9LACO|nr:hypothetical protein [Fructobacillus tropaeoli]GAP05016.1 hypothetical protein FTRO_0200090 [Fructobacillus tropaeoli]